MLKEMAPELLGAVSPKGRGRWRVAREGSETSISSPSSAATRRLIDSGPILHPVERRQLGSIHRISRRAEDAAACPTVCGRVPEC
jgi:hypothetical protein